MYILHLIKVFVTAVVKSRVVAWVSKKIEPLLVHVYLHRTILPIFIVVVISKLNILEWVGKAIKPLAISEDARKEAMEGILILVVLAALQGMKREDIKPKVLYASKAIEVE